MTDNSRPGVHRSSLRNRTENTHISMSMQQARGESNTNPVTLLKDDKKFSVSMYPRISKPQTGSETRQPTDSAKDPVALSPDKKKWSASMHSDLSKLRTGSGSIQPRDSALSLFSGNSTSASKSFTTPTSHDHIRRVSEHSPAYFEGRDDSDTGYLSRTSYGSIEREERDRLLKSYEYHRKTANCRDNLDSLGARPKERQSKDVSDLSGDTGKHMESKSREQGDIGKSNHKTEEERDWHCIRLKVYTCNSRGIRNQTWKICCDLEMYMKLKYILWSPSKLDSLNKHLKRQFNCFCTADSSIHFSTEIPQSGETLFSLSVQEFCDTGCKDVIIDSFCYGSKATAAQVVKILLDEPIVRSTHVWYAEATDENRVYIVYRKTDKEWIVGFLDQNCPEMFVQVQIPFVWLAMSEKINLKKRLEKGVDGLACLFFKRSESDGSDTCICEVCGKMSAIEKAREKLQMYRDRLKCKTYQLEDLLLNTCSQLNLCAALQEKIDKTINGACLIQLSKTGILLYAFKEEEIDRIVKVMHKHLMEKYVPVDEKWKISGKLKELQKELKEKNVGDVSLVPEVEGLRVVGLREHVNEAVDLIKHLTETESEIMDNCFSSKVSVTDHDLFGTLKLLAEDIAKNNKIEISINETSAECVLEFTGTYKAVTNTVEKFKELEIDIKKEHIFVDRNFISSKDGEQLLENLQTENRVKILHEKVADYCNLMHGNLYRTTKTKLEKQGNRCKWLFPTGKSLELDLIDIEQCNKSELIVVMTEEKQGKLETRLPSKQIKMVLPKWADGSKEDRKLKGDLRRILSKAQSDSVSSICISLEPVSGWPFAKFVENLLTAILHYVQNFTENTELVDVVLCSSSIDKVKRTEAFIRANIDPSYVENEVQIEVVRGELNLFEADVLVNTTSPNLDLNFGQVSAALLRTAGAEIQRECKERYPKGVQGPEIAVTMGYNLKCQFVFHGSLRSYSTKSQADCLQELRGFLKTCLEEANKLRVSSIAFPVIGSGNLGFPVDQVACEMFASVERFKQIHKDFSLRFVYFVVYHKDKKTIQLFEKIQEDFVKDQAARIEKEETISNEIDRVTIIGMSSDAKQAKKDLEQKINILGKKTDQFKPGDSEITQYVENISTHRFSALIKAFPVEIEQISDQGVICKWENDRIKLEGKLSLVTEAVQKINDLVKRLTGMFTKQVSVEHREESDIKMILRKLSQDLPHIIVVHDRITSLVTLYGKVQKDITEAGKHFGNDDVTVVKDTKKGQQAGQDVLGSKTGLYKPHSKSFKAKSQKIYKVKEITVTVCVGDILEAPTACIVNAANEDLLHAGGVAHAIASRAGEELRKESYQITQSGPLKVGSVVETTAGKLKDKFACVLHTVGPNWFDYKPITPSNFDRVERDLHRAILNTFQKAEDLKLKSLALPAISSAIFRVPHEVCAVQYAKAVLDFAKGGHSSLNDIYFIDKDDRIVAKIHEVFSYMITKNKTYHYDPRIYFDTQQDKGSELTGRDTTLNQQEVYEAESKDDLSSRGMVSLQPHYKLDKGKMMCMFTTFQEIHIYTGNILELNGIDAIVCSEDKSWAAAGMVARKLLDMGGKEYLQAKKKAYQESPTLDGGDFLITFGGRNRYPWVIHALVPNSKPPEALKDLTEDILEECAGRGFKSTVMSLLGSGSGKVDPAVCSKQLLTAYDHFCLRKPSYKFTLHLVNIDKEKTQILQSVFKEHIDKKSISHRIRQEAAITQGKRDNLKVTVEGGARTVQVQPENLNGYSKLEKEIKESETNIVVQQNDLKRETSTEKVKHRSITITSKYQGTSGGEEEENEPKEKKDAASAADDERAELSANCIICMDRLDNPRTLRCGHAFCSECIEQYFKVKPVCPTCFTVCGVITGDQPDGLMEIQTLRTSVAGYGDFGTVCITYRFENGKQGPQHPKPGARYLGIQRAAYLPNNGEGREICAMLKVAFERRLVFTIGTSRTTGQEGVITWNDIHHKTDHRPNTQFGYPDPTYLARVKDELAAKGVFEKDIEKDLVKRLKKESNFHEIVKSSELSSSTSTKI